MLNKGLSDGDTDIYGAVQCSTALYFAVQFNAVQYSIIQCRAAKTVCSVIQGVVIQCSEDYFGIGDTFRTCREFLCLPYAGFFSRYFIQHILI